MRPARFEQALTLGNPHLAAAFLTQPDGPEVKAAVQSAARTAVHAVEAKEAGLKTCSTTAFAHGPWTDFQLSANSPNSTQDGDLCAHSFAHEAAVGHFKSRRSRFDIQGAIEVHIHHRFGHGLTRKSRNEFRTANPVRVHFGANHRQNRREKEMSPQPLRQRKGTVGPSVSEPNRCAARIGRGRSNPRDCR